MPMPMSMLMPMQRCRCQNFQMTIAQVFPSINGITVFKCLEKFVKSIENIKYCINVILRHQELSFADLLYSVKINESQYIALFVVSGSMKIFSSMDFFLNSDSFYNCIPHFSSENYCYNILLILNVKQLNETIKLDYFHILKALWDGRGKIKMYYGMFRVKKQLSGKKSINTNLSVHC